MRAAKPLVPHIFVRSPCFWFCIPPALPPPPSASPYHIQSFTHTHTALSHAIFNTHTQSLSHTHTTLSHTICVTRHLSHTNFVQRMFVTQLCHTQSFTHNFATHNLPHTIFVTPQLCRTRNLRHMQSFTHQLCHTHTQTIFVTQLCHTICATCGLSRANFVTQSLSHAAFHTPTLSHNLCHTTLSRALFHTQSVSHTIFHTPTLSHTIFVTQLNFVTRNLSHTALSHARTHTHTPTRPHAHTPTPTPTPAPTRTRTQSGKRGAWRHPPLFARQAWQLVTCTLLLRGRRGTFGTGLALVAGVKVGDMHAAFAWQAWHFWHWAGSGGRRGSW